MPKRTATEETGLFETRGAAFSFDVLSKVVGSGTTEAGSTLTSRGLGAATERPYKTNVAKIELCIMKADCLKSEGLDEDNVHLQPL